MTSSHQRSTPRRHFLLSLSLSPSLSWSRWGEISVSFRTRHPSDSNERREEENLLTTSCLFLVLRVFGGLLSVCLSVCPSVFSHSTQLLLCVFKKNIQEKEDQTTPTFFFHQTIEMLAMKSVQRGVTKLVRGAATKRMASSLVLAEVRRRSRGQDGILTFLRNDSPLFFRYTIS